MNKNNTLKEISGVLKAAKSVLLFPHINMDGDTLGSSVALCRALRSMNKEAHILIEDEMAGFLKFMDNGYCTYNFDIIKDPDVCICVDCGDVDRFKRRKNKFFEGKQTGCIDHHVTTEPFATFNFIDSKAAATGEIIFDLINEMGVELDSEISCAIFAAITTDTGNFQYSNTTRRTHEIIACLYDSGEGFNDVSIELYQNNRPERLLLQTRILQEMRLFGEGKGAICSVTRQMFKETGGKPEETEGIIEILRNMAGVEVAIFVKELTADSCKISMRSKKFVNVAEISQIYSGGGHARAAGCTVPQSIEETKATIMNIVLEHLKG